jgi:hypothetical protein
MDATMSATAPPPPMDKPAEVAAAPERSSNRDDIGDLNRDSIKAGDFPGSFRIPGPGKVSLRVGGFIKAVALADSDAEDMGADFLPATLGTKRGDNGGGFAIDATITRLHLDARAPVQDGQLRGYVEWDLNKNNNGTLDVKWRHAYGTWTNRYGALLAGQTWSTFMDTKILPEGLTEPTVSGAIFMRQPLIRWSQPLPARFILHAAVEDPSSNDVFSNQPTLGQTKYPDGILGLEYDREGMWHLRLNSILRHIEVDLPTGGDDSKVGWGLALSGHLNLFEQDRLQFSGTYGKGLGRYLLGIQSTDGSAIDPARNKLRLRENWGALATYEHHWTDVLRSNAMFGYAYSNPFGFQSGGTLDNTLYTAANLMWEIFPYLTLGIEYAYGQRENKDHSDLDNHRVGIGFQIF